MIISHHQSPVSSWSGSHCCLKILSFLSMFTWFLLMIISGAVCMCILSSSLQGWWPWSGSVCPPGAWCGDQWGPLMPGLVMSCCAIQTPAQAHQGLSIIASVTGEKLCSGWEDFVSKVLVLLWDDRVVFVDELEWTKSIEKYFSQ